MRLLVAFCVFLCVVPSYAGKIPFLDYIQLENWKIEGNEMELNSQKNECWSTKEMATCCVRNLPKVSEVCLYVDWKPQTLVLLLLRS